MTRQSRARWLAFATALVVVLLAALFAWLRNPAPPPAAVTVAEDRATTDPADGRAAFARLGCSGCHSAEGRGNSVLPLDGVGARLDREQLRAASFALGEAGARLPAVPAGRKRAMAGDPDAEAVVDYLQRLK
jgi:mono/diheme cytochrome c family protein